jgi:ABC-2 type transport system ATP-binding protein
MAEALPVEVEDLAYRYGEREALDGVSFEVSRGELFGLLGPNGGGKTTLLQILATLRRPMRGAARVAGVDVVDHPDAARRRLGVVFQHPALDIQLTPTENLRHQGHFYGLAGQGLAARAADLLDRFGVADRAGDRVKTLSGVLRRRVELAKGLLHGPSILLLDEPTVGLDPQSSRDLRDRVRDLKAQGRTVLLTTHYMEEADQLCDRIAIVDHGRIVALDTPAGLKRTITATEVVHLEIDGGATDAALLGRLERAAGSLARQQRDDGSLQVTAHVRSARDFVPLAFDAARAEDVAIKHVEVVPVTLEDVFISLTGRALRE